MPIDLGTIENITVNIGPWLKFTPELFEAIKAEEAALVGLTFPEAAATMGFKFVKGIGYVKSISLTTEAVATGATASEAIAGTVATGAAETTTGTLVLTETATGGASVMGLGTIATGTAAIALAGACGYIIGNGIGEIIDYNFPDFFDGLFGSISKVVTGSETGLAFLFDADGHAFLPESTKSVIDEYLQNQLKNSHQSVECGDITINYTTASIGDCFIIRNLRNNNVKEVDKFEEFKPRSTVYRVGYYVKDTDKFYDNFYSREKINMTYRAYNMAANGVLTDTGKISDKNIDRALFLSNTQTYNGHTFYTTNNTWSRENLELAIEHGIEGLPIFNTVTREDITTKEIDDKAAVKILFSGVSTSKNPPIKKYDVPTKPKIKTHPKPKSDDDTEYEPETWIRIPLPEPSDDPLALPKTTPILEPEETPEREKLPKPLPQPKPQGTVAPSPDVDPSAEPSPNLKPSPTPSPTPPPQDMGVTPEPTPPVIPPISSSAAGLLHVYNPTNEQINQFGSWLWTTFSGDLIDTIAKLFNNPMEAVIGLHELYCTPITGDNTTIKAGFLDSGVTSRLVTQRYTEINCGAITIPEYWGNYLDYSPYTKCYCYLPFIGIVELNTDDIIGHGVQVLYKIDTYNGSCIAMIITAKNNKQECVKYQFSGNCAVEVPITSGMKSALQSALIGAATCAVGAMGAGLAGSAITDAAIAGGGKRGLNSKNTVAHSGSFGSSYGAMGIKKPYFIVKRPIQKVVQDYNEKYGYPAHSMVTIGNCSGYLRCRDFEVVSSTATEEEKKRIEILLKEGVYV